jgi:hypothetical protein
MANGSYTPAPPSHEDKSGRPRGPLGWLRLWFLLVDPVGRREYAVSGFGLMGCKYVVELAAIWLLAGQPYTPLDFVNPLISAREQFLAGAPDWFGWGWVLWSLPFLWIAVGMSVRRALDAGLSPWHGLWMFVPIVNLGVMLLLAIWPTGRGTAVPGDGDSPLPPFARETDVAATLKAALGAIAVGALYATVMIQVSVYLIEDYGEALFFGTPFITGVAAGYILNLRTSHSSGTTILVALLAVMLCGGALLLFALEGLICILMAAPLVVPLGIAGAPIGKFLADRRRRMRAGLLGALVVMPMWAAVGANLPPPNEFVVVTAVDIAAPPDVVWQQVIAFPDIEEQPEWYFRWGISCPQGARITGQGVGAVRECIFTTGTFREPVTTWDPPRRLAFNVREQPAPLFELTPYREIHPPHLEGTFRSTRGEFELIKRPNGGTRLVGRTWYSLDIRPTPYWAIWSDALIHRIHDRVLQHIKRLAEQG